MLRILHISDLHFGPPYVPRAGQALLDVAPSLRPDVIVASGDFTQRAKRYQFQQARSFLNQLPAVPLVVTPGNHDVPLYRVFERWFRPHALYREHIAADLNSVLNLPNAVIVALDSTAPRRAITNGRLEPTQLDFCRQALAAAPAEAVRIVVSHHPLAAAPGARVGHTLPKARHAIRHLAELGVELVLGGHLHRTFVRRSHELVDHDSPEQGIVFVQSGTTTSRRGRGLEREQHSFNLVDVSAESLTVQHFQYQGESTGFVPNQEHQVARSRRGARHK